jgi:hypothetical protein
MLREEFIRAKKKHRRVEIIGGALFFILLLSQYFILLPLRNFFHQIAPTHDAGVIAVIIITILLGLFVRLIFWLNKRLAKRFGLSCPYCHANLAEPNSTQIVVATNNCGHCGKQILDKEP